MLTVENVYHFIVHTLGLAPKKTSDVRTATKSADETTQYVRHRLAIAGGGQSRIIFTSDGLKEIYTYSGGIPRLINLIADRSLLAGMALSTTTMDRRVVHEAVENLQLKKPKSSVGKLLYRALSARAR